MDWSPSVWRSDLIKSFDNSAAHAGEAVCGVFTQREYKIHTFLRPAWQLRRDQCGECFLRLHGTEHIYRGKQHSVFGTVIIRADCTGDKAFQQRLGLQRNERSDHLDAMRRFGWVRKSDFGTVRVRPLRPRFNHSSCEASRFGTRFLSVGNQLIKKWQGSGDTSM